MAYTPINWQTGDTITAEKMNKMDNGWGVQNTQLFSETVTTADNGSGMNVGGLAYSEILDFATITVTFNGTDYTCNRVDAFDVYFYGGFSEQGPDFSVFPFALQSTPDFGNSIYTQTAGTYTVAVSAEGIEVSDNFNSAVNSCVDMSTMPMRCVSGTTTYVQMYTAYAQGRMLYFSPFPNFVRTLFITSFGESNVNFIPELSGVSATFVNGVFAVGV